MTAPRLEQRYRSVVRWYPPAWRRRFGEAMVGILLDVAGEEHRHVPARGELAHLRRSAVAQWRDSVVAETTRSWVASVSVGATAAFVVGYFFFVSWPTGFDAEFAPATLPTFGPFLNAAPLFIVPVALMFLAAMTGARLLVHGLGLVSLLAVLIAAVVRTSSGNWNGPSSTTLVFVVLAVLAANLGNPRHRASMTAVFVVVFGALAALGLNRAPGASPWNQQLVGDAGWWTIILSPALLIAAALVFVGVLVLSAAGHDDVAAAVAVAWLPWAAAASVTLDVYVGGRAASLSLALGSVALAIIAAYRARPSRQLQRQTDGTSNQA